VLAPLSFFSAFDPPVLPPYPWLALTQEVVPGFGRIVRRVARFVSRKWPEPIYELRHELGLPRGANPLFDAKHSPDLVLALFSRVLGAEQKDWPQNALITGFCYYDADAGNQELPANLENLSTKDRRRWSSRWGRRRCWLPGFLRDFSPGRHPAGDSRGAADRHRPTQPAEDNAAGVHLRGRVRAYSRLFNRAAMVVHQGGVGTTAQCLRAGKPMLIMPYSHDQPDNARRMQRLKVARVIQRSSYTPTRVARQLRAMLADSQMAQRAESVANQLASEDGVHTACDALEELYRKSR